MRHRKMAGSATRGKRSSSHPNKQAEIGVSKHALRCEFLLSLKKKPWTVKRFGARNREKKTTFFVGGPTSRLLYNGERVGLP